MHMQEKVVNNIGHRIANVLKLKRRLVDMRMRELGLSRTQWQVLLRIIIQGPATQKKLLENLDIDCAHLTRVLDQLEHNNLVARAIDKTDRRARIVTLTPHCEKHVAPQMSAYLADEDSVLLRKFNAEERKSLAHLLDKLIGNLQAGIDEHLS